MNRVGQEAKQKFYGKSFCATPEGDLADQPSGNLEGVVMASIDLKEIERTRRVWTFLRDRRPEVYGEILNVQGNFLTTENTARRSRNPKKRLTLNS